MLEAHLLRTPPTILEAALEVAEAVDVVVVEDEVEMDFVVEEALHLHLLHWTVLIMVPIAGMKLLPASRSRH